ncbi:MAG: ATP-binding cassette domain-containing protein [Verrucomicrobia bacterium]|nr:ATP-binding cassette domain-containing protein [Verrucomicrobiota bacterium]
MVRFEKVKKVFAGKAVLDGMDFDIRRGETFVIVGPSGTGKSVTLKHMVRLLTPDQGDVYVGKDCMNEATGSRLAVLRERFGYLFQGGALLAWLTVGENIALPLREKTTLTEAEIQKRVHATLEMVEMAGDYDKRPSDISGGMCKRAGLARAIVTEPEIILYDEPTSGLDPVTSRTIDALIARLKEELGVTSVVVTHDLHSALSIGSRIAMLHGGRVAETSTPVEFVKSKNEEVQSFLKSQFITEAGQWERDAR